MIRVSRLVGPEAFETKIESFAIYTAPPESIDRLDIMELK